MNSIKNPGYRTDSMFHEENGFIVEKGDYYVIRTPSNPDFWFGNLILFKRPPREGDILLWMDVSRLELGDTLQHTTFGWDSEREGIVTEFTNDGFDLDRSIVLRMGGYRPATRINEDIEVRRISEERDWRAATELEIKTGLEGRFGEGFREFKEAQIHGYRRMSAKARGDWWGAFLNDELVGSLGLFFDRERQTGRFQNVATDSAHRRKGVCTTLLDHVSRNAFEEAGVEELVIVTGDDEKNPARTVYEGVGFVELTKAFGLTRSKRKTTPSNQA